MDLNNIAEFSRSNCIGICAVLVPTNLLLTSMTMLFTLWGKSRRTIYTAIGIAIVPALILILHVVSWYAIGVVMAPTYILLVLATTCLAIDSYAAIDRQQMGAFLKTIVAIAIAKYQQFVTD
jgi:hypothetical protein